MLSCACLPTYSAEPKYLVILVRCILPQDEIHGRLPTLVSSGHSIVSFPSTCYCEQLFCDPQFSNVLQC
uniref:Uncharacterized protein n=1 Tax=Ciona intestinalis TaxID=7719 RepID=H2XQB2_CIOIN